MTVCVVLLAVLAVYLAVGSYTFVTACGPWKHLDFLDENQLRGTVYESSHQVIVAAHSWLNTNGAKDIWTESEDGLRLHARWLPAMKPKGTLLLVHGYHSTPWADFGRVIRMYHDLGYNLLLPDQRCHGQSEGRYVTFGVKECKDMLSWLRYHNQELCRQSVIISGVSMGAATVMYLADEALPSNVVGLIADCGYTSPDEIIGKVFRDITHLPPVPWIWVTRLCAQVFARFSFRQKDARKTLAKNTLPFLLVHGEADALVPCQMGKEIFAACTGEKRLLLVPGAGHAMSFTMDKEHYTKELLRMLGRSPED